MRNICSLLGGFALLACPSVVIAAPSNPLNAANTTSGTGCLVRAGENDPLQPDGACEWHQVVKRDQDGSLVSFHYQDKGTLQEGQTAPDHAVRIVTEGFTVGGLDCSVVEVVMPSGSTASYAHCR